MFQDVNLKLEAEEYTFLDDTELRGAISEAIHSLGTGKALSTDLIPDSCFDKERLIRMTIADRKLIFSGPRLRNSLTAQAVLISKTGHQVVEPPDTRMIVVQPLITRIFDKTCQVLVQRTLRQKIGPYQTGFTQGSSTLDNTLKIIKKLKLGEPGRKKRALAIFVDFKRAFDCVDRMKLVDILKQRI